MRKASNPSIGVLLAAALAIPVAAQQMRVYHDASGWGEEISGALPAAGTLVVKMEAGGASIHGDRAQKVITYRFRVHAQSGNEVEARRELQKVKTSASKAGNIATLQVSLAPEHVAAVDVLEVALPQNTALVRMMTRGNASVNNIAGRIEVASGGGNLYVDQIGGLVKAVTAGGNVVVGTAGGDVELSTGGGNVNIDSVKGRLLTSSGGGSIVVTSVAQGVNVQTGGGAINVQRCGGPLTAQSGGGNLDVGQISGKVMLQTTGGSIHMTSASGPVVATTGAGQIELYGITDGAQLQTGAGRIVAEFLGGPSFTGGSLETGMGDVIVYLSPSLKATIHAEVLGARGHHIQSDFPAVKTNEIGRGLFGVNHLSADGALNGGGPAVRIRATRGDIELRRASK